MFVPSRLIIFWLINQQCIINVYVCGMARTHDHRIGSQALYPIESNKFDLKVKCILRVSFMSYIIFVNRISYCFFIFVLSILCDGRNITDIKYFQQVRYRRLLTVYIIFNLQIYFQQEKFNKI